jgi:plasmid maintenance system antidote protein VapI
MPTIVHPGRLLKRELDFRGLSAIRLALYLGVPSGRTTDILNGRRGISADTALPDAAAPTLARHNLLIARTLDRQLV